MNLCRSASDRSTFLLVGSLALAAVLLSGGVVAVSSVAWPEGLLQFEQAEPSALPADIDIRGSATFDKSSYFTGEVATYELEIFYRTDEVQPDLGGFSNRISLFPFEHLSTSKRVEDIGNGIRRFVLRYDLQVLTTRRTGSYQFEPAVLYYSEAGEDNALKSLRIGQPRVYLSSYYPPNIANVAMMDLKGRIRDQGRLRKGLLVLGALALLVLALFLLWRFGRRRRLSELTEAERLWRQFNSVRGVRMDNRAHLLACERIFSRILQSYADISPQVFWSGGEPEDRTWSTPIARAREVLRRTYLAAAPTSDDVRQTNILLTSTLSSLVEEEKLLREQQPSFVGRLLEQPLVLAFTGVLAGTSILILILCIYPSTWVNPDIRQYNATMAEVQSGSIGPDDSYRQLAALGDNLEVEKVKAAALYNAGTLKAGMGFDGVSEAQQRMLLGVVFAAASPEELIEAILLSGIVNSHEEVVTLLINGAEQFRRAERNLEMAARIQRNDDRILRNLELVTKRRHALLARLAELRELFSAGSEDGDNSAASEEGLLNIIEANLPEDYKQGQTTEGEKAYMILERF